MEVVYCKLYEKVENELAKGHYYYMSSLRVIIEGKEYNAQIRTECPSYYPHKDEDLKRCLVTKITSQVSWEIRKEMED